MDENPTMEDLSEAIQKRFDETGVADEVKALIRARILNLLAGNGADEEYGNELRNNGRVARHGRMDRRAVGERKVDIRGYEEGKMDFQEERELYKRAAVEDTSCINELIREYFQFRGYLNALSVFQPECGISSQPSLSRQDIAKELNIKLEEEYQPSGERIPLLYSILGAMKSGK